MLGRAAHAGLGALPEAPELVVIAVPVGDLPIVVDAALRAGARAIVAISSGQTEVGLDAALVARVRAAGAVLLGPNCLGVMDAGALLELVSNRCPPDRSASSPQSGNLALELGRLAAEQQLGFSRFVSLGNQADLEATDLVRSLAAHEATRLIAVYIEDFRDGRAFAAAAAEAVAAGTPVVVMAIAHAEATARAVRSHTGALASDAAAIDAACAAAGVLRVHTPQQLIDVAAALLRAPLPAGARTTVLSTTRAVSEPASPITADQCRMITITSSSTTTTNPAPASGQRPRQYSGRARSRE